MIKIKKAPKGTIKPQKPFTSIEEEANFWDKHSVVNEGTFAGFHQVNKTEVLTIRFAHEDLQKLRNEAHQKGIGPSTLARMWLKEKIQTI